MAGTQTRIQVAAETGFRRRVEALLVGKALGVLAQANPDAAHAAFAKLVLRRQVDIEIICYAALTITAVDAAGMNVSDADLDTALNTVLPTLAKVAV